MTTPQPDSPAPAPKIDDGGSVYPYFWASTAHDNTGRVGVFQYEGCSGISARDYFAAAAMQGMIGCGGTYDKWATLARDAFDVADAMLAARKGGVA